MSFLKVAGLQTEIIWEDKKENFSRIKLLTQNLEGYDLIILPETFSTGFTMRSELFSEELEGETESFLFELACKTKSIVGGSWIEKNSTSKPFNTFSLLSPNGIICRYRKIHPFSYAGEDKVYSSGREVKTFDYKNFRITPLICYDLRFPETFREVVGKTEIYLVIANWPASRIFAWLSLLKARAIENQAYVIGVNRVGIAGRKEKIYHNGYSSYFTPWGEEKMVTSEQQDLLSVIISLPKLEQFRKEFPYLQDIKKINF